MEIIGEMQGRHTDAAIWKYFGDHWSDWFPALGSYQNFAKHCANLRWMKEEIQRQLFPANHCLHIIDGVPMPVCHFARSYRARSLAEYTEYGYCAAKDEHYYGLRGHPVINHDGYIVHCTYTPANVDEREVLDNLRTMLSGTLLGDKGFLSEPWRVSLHADGIDLQTPKRKNMKEDRSPEYLAWMMKTRKTVETVISTLCESFAFNRIKARSIHHFINKTARKILAYNFQIRLQTT